MLRDFGKNFDSKYIFNITFPMLLERWLPRLCLLYRWSLSETRTKTQVERTFIELLQKCSLWTIFRVQQNS